MNKVKKQKYNVKYLYIVKYKNVLRVFVVWLQLFLFIFYQYYTNEDNGIVEDDDGKT